MTNKKSPFKILLFPRTCVVPATRCLNELLCKILIHFSFKRRIDLLPLVQSGLSMIYSEDISILKPYVSDNNPTNFSVTCVSVLISLLCNELVFVPSSPSPIAAVIIVA